MTKLRANFQPLCIIKVSLVGGDRGPRDGGTEKRGTGCRSLSEVAVFCGILPIMYSIRWWLFDCRHIEPAHHTWSLYDGVPERSSLQGSSVKK